MKIIAVLLFHHKIIDQKLGNRLGLKRSELLPLVCLDMAQM